MSLFRSLRPLSRSHRSGWSSFCGGALLVASAWAAQPQAAVAAAAPQDQGLAAAETPQTISIVLKARRPEQLADYIAATVNPYSPYFHRFLSTEEFANWFAPSPREINVIVSTLKAYGITVSEVYADRLLIKATGTVGQFSQAFDTEIHRYERDGRHFNRPSRRPRAPATLEDYVLSIVGLDTQQDQFRPMLRRRPDAGGPLANLQAKVVLPPAGSTATGVPGSYTVGDLARQYNVTPLYDQRLSGKGTTIGIATLADFDPNDAYAYWKGINLKVKPNRITQVRVDGGAGPSADGSGETALDVEQSGGLAPEADLIVYDAPNTDSGFVDMFYRAVSDNKVDALSVSWGSAEVVYLDSGFTGADKTSDLLAFNQAFMEAAAQGISLYGAAGDAGAYELNGDFQDVFNRVLTVLAPTSSPYMTAAGGTTLPVTIKLKLGEVNVPTERVWAWDYFNDYLVTHFGPDAKDGDFPVGGGGGVSVFWPVPSYQRGLPGVRKSEPNQVIALAPGVQDEFTPYPLPAHFAGRNLPDVSLNADPESGYLVYSTTDGGWISGYGGTSFVAPQLNGLTALFVQSQRSRIGFFNPQAYALASSRYSRWGKSPFNDIGTGTNWGYPAVKGYDPATGLGTIDVSALNAALPRRW